MISADSIAPGTLVRFYGPVERAQSAFPGNRPEDVARLNARSRFWGFPETAQLGGEPHEATFLGLKLPYRRGWGGPFARICLDDGTEAVVPVDALEIV